MFGVPEDTAQPKLHCQACYLIYIYNN